MTNREKYILKRNEYDMLTGIQLAMAHGEKCVVDAIMRKQWDCANYIKQDAEVCSRCIQNWLNEEAK
jgi:hypothetical protein